MDGLGLYGGIQRGWRVPSFQVFYHGIDIDIMQVCWLTAYTAACINGIYQQEPHYCIKNVCMASCRMNWTFVEDEPKQVKQH